MTIPDAVTAIPALLGESPVWDDRTARLLWVDIDRGEVHEFDPQGDDRLLADFDMPVGAVAPRHGTGYVLAADRGFWLLDGDEATLVEDVTDRGERMNDGKCDPSGRFWAGTMTADRRPGAALYRMDAQRNVRSVLGSVALSNGLGWSPRGTTMYYVDTPTRRIEEFDFVPETGAVRHRGCFVDLASERGNPDGLTVDAEGGVWVAMANGWAVHRYAADGVLDRVIEVPAQKVTSCTFGGADLGDLYITTASAGLSEDELRHQPQAGLLMRCRPGFTGLPANAYAG